MRKPLQPFNDKTANEFDVTSHYSRPVDVFDYSSHLDYHYDSLKLNSWTIPQLEEVLKQQRSVPCVCVCVCWGAGGGVTQFCAGNYVEGGFP